MSADVFDLDLDPLTRDRYGRPMLVPADGGEKVPFTRASTLANYICDSSALSTWTLRNVVMGLGQREDLWTLAGSLPPLADATKHKSLLTKDEKKRDRETKKALDEIIDAAREQAYGSFKARLGTSAHNACEPDADLTDMPSRLIGLANNFKATLLKAGIRIVATEKFVVNDALGAAGSFDHIVWVPGFGFIVLDIKSGSVDAASDGLKHSVQLATYATAELYDVEADERTPLASLTEGEMINTQYGMIAHLPIDGGDCVLYLVDLEVGMRAAKLATMVRTARSLKDIMFPAATIGVES